MQFLKLTAVGLIFMSSASSAQQADATAGVAQQIGLAVISFEQCRASKASIEQTLSETQKKLAEAQAELAKLKNGNGSPN